MGSNKISTIDLEEPVVETLNTIDTVADQVTVVSGNTNTILTTVQDNNAKISAINANVDSVNVNVDNSKTMIENMEARINEMENNINAGFQQNKLDSNSISAALSGASSPYGTGILGDVVYDPSTFLWGTPDHLGRYMLYAESFTVPEGVTMTPPARCNGVYIFSKGDVTINGTIDLRSKRILSANVSIPDTITVDGVEYALAKGGDSQKGGNGGASGQIKGTLKAGDYTAATYTITKASGGNAQTPIAGSVCGGGYGSYGTGATGKSTNEYYLAQYKWMYHQGDYYFSWVSNDYEHTAGSNVTCTAGTSKQNESSPCALVIIASGKVTINGSIVSNGGGGITATNGTETYPTSTGNAPSSATGYGYSDNNNEGLLVSQSCRAYIYAGSGGNGTCPPTGGGPVTIICSTFTNTGIINTSGDKISAAGVTDGTLTTSNYTKSYSTALIDGDEGKTEMTAKLTAKVSSISGTAAVAGEDLTCISTAGEIKVYERGA